MPKATKRRELRIEYMRLDEVKPDPNNPKDHDLGALAQSFERFGYIAPGAINERTGRLLYGHGRWQELLTWWKEGREPPDGVKVDEDGMWLWPVIRGVQLSPRDGHAYVIADNRHVELGGWDEGKLVDSLLKIAGKNGKGLRGTGYDGDDLDALIRMHRPDLLELPEAPEPQIDKAEELQRKWKTQDGQVWEIGRHRLMCGDSTNQKHVLSLMAGASAEWMWTDPPYGVDYVGRTKDALVIKNDSAQNLRALLDEAFASADAVLNDGAPIYIAHPAGALSIEFGLAFMATGWHLHGTLVWVKNSMVLGHSDYHYKHEPIYYGWKGTNRKWYGGRRQVSVFEVVRPSRSELHPTIKPIELIAAHLRNSSRQGDLGYDPFVGSGSTIIAAEMLGRICYGMEIEPKYVAVALQCLADMGLEPRLVHP